MLLNVALLQMHSERTDCSVLPTCDLTNKKGTCGVEMIWPTSFGPCPLLQHLQQRSPLPAERPLKMMIFEYQVHGCSTAL